jgi:hypothetical protein
MSWPGWYKVSVRKPLAVAAFVFCSVLSAASFLADRDIPTNTAEILKWSVCVCIGGYCGSSAYETVGTGAKREEKDE